VLLTPTRIYAKQVLALAAEFPIKAVAHITGGGLTENLPRVCPNDCRARIRRGSWTVPPIFPVIRKIGHVDEAEMYRVFNMGIGLVLVVPPKDADGVIARAATFGDKGYVIGDVVSGGPGVEYV